MSDQNNRWTKVADQLPTDGEVVDTKIDDSAGVRNHCVLKRQGRLWFTRDGEMYVYYTPTHWRAIPFAGEAI